MSGKLIVLEGTDGSGKSTQFSLLCQHMEQENRAFQKLIFPQYQEPSSALLKMYLNGEFGQNPSDVNAYAASTFYAVDRYASWKKVWGADYDNGALILSDRYSTSNAVHQTGKLPEAEWSGFLDWLFDFEYNKLGLPAPDLVLYLDMPTEKAVEMLRSRESATHTKADIHEVTPIISPIAAAWPKRPRSNAVGCVSPAWTQTAACARWRIFIKRFGALSALSLKNKMEGMRHGIHSFGRGL